MIELMNWILANGGALLAGVTMVLSGVIAIAMMIPGEQPEKALQKILDFISKLSNK